MQFALNYSPQAAELISAGRIQIDLYKCPDWPDLIEKASQQYPVYIHFPLIAGQRNIEAVGLDKIEHLLETTSTPYVNTHIAPLVKDLEKPDDPDYVARYVLEDVMPLVERFGADRVIVENIPYPDIINDIPQTAILPHVIERIVYESGCGLLLDIAHARLTADYLGTSTRDYITQLPVERLRELHVTGVGIDREGRRNDHLPMTGEDWGLLEWALGSIRRGMWGRPSIVACEYGGVSEMFEWRSQASIILDDVPRMYEMIRQLQYV